MGSQGRRGVGWAAGALALGLVGCGPGGDLAGDAETLLARAAAAMGEEEARVVSGPWVIHASGTLDKWAEGQGLRPDAPSPGPVTERIAVDPSPGGAASRSYREERFDGTWEAFGEIYAADTLRTLLLADLGLAIPFHGPGFGDERRAIRRRLPHFLVAELRSPGAQPAAHSGESGAAVVEGRLADGTRVRLEMEPETGLPRAVEWEQSLPGRGAVRLRWGWEDWREVAPGLRLPFTWRARVGARPLADLRVDSVELEAEGAFRIPDDLRRLPLRPAVEEPDGQLRPEPLAPGIWRVPGVRSGFAALVAEGDSSLTVVDAPTSFPLLGGIPAGETDPSSSMSGPAERLLDALARAFPDKPVRRLVLTHHHEDHVGGVRAFVAAGATVTGSPESLAVARRLVALPDSVVPDRLAAARRSGEAPPFRADTVLAPRTVGSGPGRLELVPVGDNPHAEGMLVVEVPAADALFVSDLATPAPLEGYPAAHHAALDRFLAGWLEETGREPRAVWSMHGSGALEPDHLRRLRGGDG